ncbi:MAG: TIGR03560 family F420-dependent LLM class oxidoreductase [Chloroflexota bacterium]
MAAQIGIMLEGQFGLNWEHLEKIATTVEASGYQCLFRSDHFSIGADDDSLELWMSLNWLATNTERIEFGPLVTPITFRHPSNTVRYGAAVDDLSDGRLILGLGAGWNESEHTQWGLPFYDFPTRFNMLQEQLELTIKLLDNDGPVSYEGEHFSLKDAILLPRPQRRTPILIGGNGPKKTLPMVAEFADEWNAVFTDLATYRDRAALLDGYLEERGRKKTAVKRSLMTRVVYGKTDADVKARAERAGEDLDELREKDRIVGTPQEIVDKLGAFVDAGVERFMLQWLDMDDTDGMAAMARDILPHFHTD